MRPNPILRRAIADLVRRGYSVPAVRNALARHASALAAVYPALFRAALRLRPRGRYLVKR